jgi:hypothetical protein
LLPEQSEVVVNGLVLIEETDFIEWLARVRSPGATAAAQNRHQHSAGRAQSRKAWDGGAKTAISLPDRREPAPSADMMTGCEALTWIAFGKAFTKEQLGAAETVRLRKWETPKLDDLLRALEARTSEQPYTPLEGTFSHVSFMWEYVGRACAPSLRTLRGKARSREGRLISFREMHDELAHECGRLEHDEALLSQASSLLSGACASERVIAFGQQHQGLEPEAVQATFFMDSTVEITWWNTAESELGWRRLVNVQFRTAEILALWPGTPASVDRPADETAAHQESTSGWRSARLGTAKLPLVAPAALVTWYIDRRDNWQTGCNYPSADKDLSDARDHFKRHTVTRDAVRAVRADHAPEEWKAHGRRKLAQN